MLYREIMAVCSEIHTKHINTLCGQNVELLNVKLAVHIVTTWPYTVLQTELHQFSNQTFIPQITIPRSPWTLHSVRWHIISVDAQYGSCFVPPFCLLLSSCLTQPQTVYSRRFSMWAIFNRNTRKNNSEVCIIWNIYCCHVSLADRTLGLTINGHTGLLRTQNGPCVICVLHLVTQARTHSTSRMFQHSTATTSASVQCITTTQSSNTQH